MESESDFEPEGQSDAYSDDESDFDPSPAKKAPKKKASSVKKPAAKSKAKAKAKATPKRPATSAKKSSAKPSKASATVKKKAKPKVKAMTGNSAETLIFNYVNDANKPFNSTAVFENLHKKVSKPNVKKILEKLAKAGKISMKMFGKTAIFFADQSQYDDITVETIDGQLEEIVALKAARKVADAELRVITAQRDALRSAPTTTALRAELVALDASIVTGGARVAASKAAGRSVEPGQRDALVARIVTCRREWRKRKRATKEFLGMFEDGRQVKKYSMCAEIGLEMDFDDEFKAEVEEFDAVVKDFAK